MFETNFIQIQSFDEIWTSPKMEGFGSLVVTSAEETKTLKTNKSNTCPRRKGRSYGAGRGSAVATFGVLMLAVIISYKIWTLTASSLLCLLFIFIIIFISRPHQPHEHSLTCLLWSMQHIYINRKTRKVVECSTNNSFGLMVTVKL